MRQFFYKAKLLILIYIIVALLFSLGGVALLKNEFTLEKSFEQLSDFYVVGAISQNEELGATFTTEQLIALIKENTSNDFILAKEFMGIYGRAIYTSNPKLFQLNLIKGRNFTKKDYENHTNTVIISDTISNKCTQRDGHLFYAYGADEYEVIGVYKGEEYTYANTVECYFNLNSNYLKDELYFSDFIYDSGKSSQDQMGKIATIIKTEYPETFIDFAKVGTNESSQFVSTMNNFKSMWGMLIITALLVFLNSFSTCRNWLDGKKKEIGIRQMVGAERRHIYQWILRSYFSLTGISFCIGICLSKLFLIIVPHLPVAASTNLMFGNQLVWQGIALGFLMMALVGLVTIGITLRSYSKKELIWVVRC